MTTPTDTTRLTKALRRRVRAGSALRRGAGFALGVACLVVATVAVTRVFGVVIEPSWPWVAALPVLLLGAWWWAGRTVPGDAALAAWLDRRAGAQGLLVLASERDPGPWRSQVERSARGLRLPSVEVLRPLARVGMAVGMVAALAWLPLPPASRAVSRQVAIQAALERARDEIRTAADAEVLQRGDEAELNSRANELEERLLAGDPVTWADVDALEDALDQQESVQRNELARITARAGALADAATDGLEAGELDPRELAEIARLAEQLGLARELTPELRGVLDRLAKEMERTAKESEGRTQLPIDPAMLSKLGLDAEQLRALAEELAKMGGTRLSHAAMKGRIPDLELSALRDLLEREGRLAGGGEGEAQAAEGGGEFDPEPHEGDGEGRPGRGGISRGRGDATLEFSGDTELDTSALRPERLAPGQPYHDRWQDLDVVRAEPIVNPGTITPGGGTAGAGSGRATFHRDLAPRHRAAVQRFFSPDTRR